MDGVLRHLFIQYLYVMTLSLLQKSVKDSTVLPNQTVCIDLIVPRVLNPVTT